LLIATARRHYVDDFPGPLSIKTVIQGKVAWNTDRRDIWVDDSSFLVLNDGVQYSMNIDVSEPVTTCCVFFAKGFVELVGRDLSVPIERRLDDPRSTDKVLHFSSCLHPHSERLAARLASLRLDVSAGVPAMDLDEDFVNLASELLLHHEETKKQMNRIPAARASTRAELFARVARGREFLHAECYGQIRLADAARAACLSPFHFQRTFVRAFGKSPASYVTDLRLAKAVQLLKCGMPVTEVCFAVGFESLGSFSTTFRKYLGVSPSSCRC
jgi:AraC family transcriptional regulator